MASDGMPAFRRALTSVVADPNAPDFTVRQLALLMRLAEIPQGQPGPSTNFFANELRVDKPVVTRAVRRLRDEGYAVQVRSPADERKVEISATQAGRAFVAKIAKAMQAA